MKNYVPPLTSLFSSLLLVAATTSFCFGQSEEPYVIEAELVYVEDNIVPSPVDGIVTSLELEEGATVSKDTLMFQIDSRMADSEVTVAETELKAAVEKAENDANIRFSRAKFETADVEYKRVLSLVSKGSASESELQERELNRTQAELAIEVADLERRNDIAAAEIASAKLAAAKVQQSMRQVVAPFNGVIVEKNFKQAEYVRAGEKVLRLVNLGRIRAIGYLPTKDLLGPSYLLQDAPVRISIVLMKRRDRGQPETVDIDASISYIRPVEESNGAYRFWLEFDNPMQNGVHLIRQGMEATITITSPYLQRTSVVTTADFPSFPRP